jgi:hypothetical protein
MVRFLALLGESEVRRDIVKRPMITGRNPVSASDGESGAIPLKLILKPESRASLTHSGNTPLAGPKSSLASTDLPPSIENKSSASRATSAKYVENIGGLTTTFSK